MMANARVGRTYGARDDYRAGDRVPEGSKRSPTLPSGKKGRKATYRKTAKPQGDATDVEAE